jgi:hypothetical protein
LTVVDPQQLAKEKMEQFSAAAQKQGKEAAALARQGLGKLAGRVGKVVLACTLVLWVAWFSFPVINVNLANLAGVPVTRSFTLWDYQGIYWSPGTLPANMQSDGLPLPSHGAFSLLGLAVIAAPLLVPFLRDWRARFLNTAPIAYLALLFLKYQWDLHKAVENINTITRTDRFWGGMIAEQAQAAMQSTTWDYGAYVIAAASVVLALRVLKKS